MRLPSREDVVDRRAAQFKDSITEVFGSQDLAFFEQLVASYAEEHGREPHGDRRRARLPRAEGSAARAAAGARPPAPSRAASNSREARLQAARPIAAAPQMPSAARPRPRRRAAAASRRARRLRARSLPHRGRPRARRAARQHRRRDRQRGRHRRRPHRPHRDLRQPLDRRSAGRHAEGHLSSACARRGCADNSYRSV